VPSLADYDIPTLADLFASWGFARAHAAKVLRSWYAQSQLPSPTTIGHPLHARIDQKLLAPQTRLLHRQQSSDGTLKLLLALIPTGNWQLISGNSSTTIESVLMPSHRPDRAAGCLSSQVGCAMGCDFCASTDLGLQRNLTTGEIVEQFLHLKREANARKRRLQTIVLMGMGEPLLNYDNVIAAIQRIADPSLGALGWRQVTLSTVGIVPGIERLTRDDPGIQLAVSLHAPDDDTRSKIIPTARKFKVADILEAAHAYQQASGRITNIEYCLLKDVNDSQEQARLLAHLLKDKHMHVNLIPHNPIGPGLSGRNHQRPPPHVMQAFAQTLRESGITTHFRQPRGDDIDAACGQLRRKTLRPTDPVPISTGSHGSGSC
jgi:23S rRNA (adenine2503-C2)-methyltransferase